MRAEPVERLFRALTHARRERVFHPQGAPMAGRATLQAIPALAGTALRAGGCDAVVRLSRAFGLPFWLGDVDGLAVRLGAGDLLLATSFDGAAGKWVPRPRRHAGGRVTFSGLLPYRVPAGHLVIVGAWADLRPEASWDRAVAAGEPPRQVVLWAATAGGRPVPFARIDDLRPLPAAAGAELAFDPWRAPVGLVPAGRINRLRRPAYRGSERARGAR